VLPLPVLRVAEVAPPPPGTPWLIENLWLAAGVGLLGGQAKVCKTYLAAELSLAVATGLHALGRYPTLLPGPVLFYGAEDSLTALRTRFDGLATTRGCKLDDLAVYLIDVPVLRLDRDEDLKRLRAALEKCRPRLLVLDPFVRLVGHIDENSAADVSAVLGSLRAIQRDHEVAILLVHHARKSPAAHPNQAYRGSSDFAAWSDSNLFLTRNANRLVLSVEHRSAPSPEPIPLRFEQEPAPHLVPLDVQSAPTALPEADRLLEELRHLLENAAHPLSTVELRDRLRRRKSDVVTALEKLRTAGWVSRTADGWQRPRG
jgi:hypothetical protein